MADPDGAWSLRLANGTIDLLWPDDAPLQQDEASVWNSKLAVGRQSPFERWGPAGGLRMTLSHRPFDNTGDWQAVFDQLLFAIPPMLTTGVSVFITAGILPDFMGLLTGPDGQEYTVVVTEYRFSTPQPPWAAIGTAQFDVVEIAP